MLNISKERLVEFPYAVDGSVIKVNGKPVILKVSHSGSSTYRNALIEAKRMDDVTEQEKIAFIAAEILNGHENLMDEDTPVDCSDKEKLKALLLESLDVAMAIMDGAKKKRPWTTEPSNDTSENSDG